MALNRNSFQPQTLIPFLESYPSTGRLLVALSGGVDSTVLLYALAHLYKQGELKRPPSAIHIHHGLQQMANQWVEHCQQLCDQLNIPLITLQVDATALQGESPEAAAREARYRAIESVLEAEDQLLTAHHQQDQAETFLLRALRGSGPRGLAAMREARPLGQGALLRPLLLTTQQSLLEYAEREQLQWIEDPSNQQLDADRNFLRQKILPQLQSRWPAAATTLSRSASHCEEAEGLMQQWGARQLSTLVAGDPLPLVDGEPAADSRVRIRGWFDLNRVDPPDTAHMDRILLEVVAAREDAAPLVEWPAIDGTRVRVRRFQGALYFQQNRGVKVLEQEVVWDWSSPLLLTEESLLQASREVGGGVSMASLQGKKVTVGWRAGGERCQPLGGKQRRTLKNLLREQGIPPWEREQIPLVFVEDELAQVVGYFICKPFQAKTGENGVKIEVVWRTVSGDWQNDP